MNRGTSRGFTLIELLVVIAIISILSTIVLYNYRSFGDRVLVSNLAYDIGQSIREAQNFSLAARDSAGGSSFGGNNKYYGILFGDMSTVGTDKHYLLFYDVNSSGANLQKYNGTSQGKVACSGSIPNATDECVKVYTITNGMKIKQICVVGGGAGGVDKCSSTAADPKFLEITFKRPNPDALIYDNLVSNTHNLETKPVRIEVTNSSGTVTKSVVVTQTGQISIQ